jgi:hypothetical protein
MRRDRGVSRLTVAFAKSAAPQPHEQQRVLCKKTGSRPEYAMGLFRSWTGCRRRRLLGEDWRKNGGAFSRQTVRLANLSVNLGLFNKRDAQKIARLLDCLTLINQLSSGS